MSLIENFKIHEMSGVDRFSFVILFLNEWQFSNMKLSFNASHLLT